MDPLLPLLGPVLDEVAALDLSDPTTALQTLRVRLPDAAMAPVTEALIAAHASATLTPRRAGPTLTFGRLARATPETRDLSVDVVDMRGAGAVHAHPRGEVSWCIPLEGDPRFEGAASGWVVLPPGSRHVPEVVGGRMLIVYFLPAGAMDWS